MPPRTARRACFLVLAACAGGGGQVSSAPASPTGEPLPVETIGEPIIVGGYFDLLASCDGLDDAIRLADRPADDLPTPCGPAIRLEAACGAACRAETPHPKHGARGMRVHLIHAGAQRIPIAIRGERGLRRKELAVTVANPDSIAVECMSGRTQRFGPCDRDGVAALKPRVRIVAMLGGHATSSSQWRINGRAAPSLFSEVVSLAVVYPEATDGDQGVRPGRYTLEVSLGDKREHITFEAHD